MPAKAPDNFAQIFPEHPHRRVHILISILAFVLVAGSIIVYQINKSKEPVENGPGGQRVETEISEAYMAQVLEDLEVSASSTPPEETERARLKALEELRKANQTQNNN